MRRSRRRATTRFPNSTNAWKSFAGKGVSPQRGQLSQPSPEPVSRTKAPEATTRPSSGDACRTRSGGSAGSETGARSRARDAHPERHAASLLDPADRVNASQRPRRRRSPRAPPRLLGGERDEQAAGGLRVVGERLELGRRRARDVRPGELPVAPVAAGAHALGRELERAGERRQRLGVERDADAAARRPSRGRGRGARSRSRR